jgi:hypothetical protein
MRIFGIVACGLLFAASLCLPQAHGTNNRKTSEAVGGFVQGFYDWYVPVALRDNPVPASDIALKQRPAVFSPVLFRALKEDSEAQAKAQGYIVGIDFDPFLASQDPCDRYEVGTVAAQKVGYSVKIYGVCSGKRNEKPDVVAEVARQDGSWAFTNFIYPAIHRDLLGILRTLREERRKSSR